MPEQPEVNIKQLLVESHLLDKTEEVGETMCRLRWGSAMVLAGIVGRKLVAIAPLFRNPPEGKEKAFFRRILELNGTLSGVVSFAIQPDGWIVLQAGRDLQGMDADEFTFTVSTVAKYADDFDDQLYDEFYAGTDVVRHEATAVVESFSSRDKE